MCGGSVDCGAVVVTADASSGDQARQLYEGTVADWADWADKTELLPVERHLFGRHLHAGMDILDLGVGAGRTTPHLSGLANRYVGLDYAAGMVDACRQRFPDLAFHHGDAADLSAFEDGSFDAVVFSFGGIDDLTPAAKRARCLAECRRVLRGGGVLIISRHNPRAIVRLPGQPGQDGTPVRGVRALVAVPVWSVRRACRLLVTRAFWVGEGVVDEPSYGFNAPLLPWARSRRASGPPRPGIPTGMATPRRVRQELRRAGFTPVAVEGTTYPRRPWALSTNWYYYVATRTD